MKPSTRSEYQHRIHGWMLYAASKKCSTRLADATAYISYVIHAVVQFKWEGHAEGRAKENGWACRADRRRPLLRAAVRPSTGTRPDVTLGASNQESVSRSGSGAGSGAFSRIFELCLTPANSISGSVLSVSSQMVHETSVPTVFFGMVGSEVYSAAASTKELLVTADLVLSEEQGGVRCCFKNS